MNQMTASQLGPTCGATAAHTSLKAGLVRPFSSVRPRHSSSSIVIAHCQHNTAAVAPAPRLRPSLHQSLRCSPRSSLRGNACRSRSMSIITRAAMFDNLSKGLDQAWKQLSSNAVLNADNIKQPLRDIRTALLEADVSLPVVKDFIKRVEEKALGQEVIPGVNPQMALIKVVHDELVELMGSKGARELEPGTPQIILMAGLQGVGKTTCCGKLAASLKKQGKRVMMVATDVYRPAAIEQLVKLGKIVDVPVFELGTDAAPVDIARRGVEAARQQGMDAVIVDTAGRLQVDSEMMQELRDVKAAVKPTDTLLVVDAMTGQEAASLVKTFHDAVGLSGSILSKLDGDARGGSALSIHAVSSQPIKFIGTGEGMEELETFYPERMAQRVLGMGDVLTLYEKAVASMNKEDTEAIMQRILEDKFDMNDFLKQWQSLNNMGGMKMMKLIPGFSQVSEKKLYEAEKQLQLYESMITAMDPEERTQPNLLVRDVVRRRRVAQQSGVPETQVTSMVAAFNAMKTQMTKVAKAMQSGPGGKPDHKAMAEAMAGAQPGQGPPGRGKKDKEKVKPAPKPKTKGFGFAKK